MTSEAAELTPEERKRRKAELAQGEKVARKHGFRPVAARPGWWYHEDIRPEHCFPFTVEHCTVESQGDLLSYIFEQGRRQGTSEVRTMARAVFGL